ncbi:AAA family ATPase [Chelativorans intermedius]|uniref:Helicase RepA family protein n=1 Tax=Chelativorans intermedius TaxID=515947 RepID=A0ABV6D9P5_9HYPH|nr:helicase RepA family protein [Chelativorans intermedius]MCT8999122.1 helicase RepA family protein [Chelativorans intermedius]
MNEIIPLEEYERRQGKRPRLRRVNTNVLMKKDFEPIRWIVPGYLPEGFSVLAGRQKLGKTWLAIDWALAVATGGCAMGSIEVEPGDVLYLDLENGERRIQRRIATLFPGNLPDLSRLEWATEAPMVDGGLIEALEDWRQSVANPRLVVIDVLQRIKPAGKASRNSYENDYSIWAPLQKWATQHGIAVLGLHHTKKGGADDPLEALSGSNGLSACADTTIVLDRDGNGTTLYVRGRDVDEKETALSFTDGLWNILGDANKVRTTDERRAILDVLAEADEAMSPSDIAAAAGMSAGSVRFLLFKMVKADEVKRHGRGKYVHPANVSGDDTNTANNANNANKALKSVENQFVADVSALNATANKPANVSDVSAHVSTANIPKHMKTRVNSQNVSDVSDVLDDDGIPDFIRSPV